MKTRYPLFAIAAILLWSSCTKQEGDIFETPIAVPVAVDTLAFLTGCQWHWFANGIDADSNRLLDVGSIKPVTGFELYNFCPNGDLLDSAFVADTPVYYVKWSWQFGNGKSSLFFYDERMRLHNDAYVIVDISDTSMMLRPLFSPKGAWRLYRKYVRK